MRGENNSNKRERQRPIDTKMNALSTDPEDIHAFHADNKKIASFFATGEMPILLNEIRYN